MALDVFTTTDTFGRFADGAARVRSTIAAAISGELDVAAGVEEGRRQYQRAGERGDMEMIVDAEASTAATVIEVHATDQVGLLYRLARTIATLEIDVSLAKVATLGDHVIDVLYLTQHGEKLHDTQLLGQLRERIEHLAYGATIAP